MILPGRVAFSRGILSGLRCEKTQVQPCGIDLTLNRVLSLKSRGSIDFDNSRRKTATSKPIQMRSTSQSAPPSAILSQGVYLIEFNERVCMPLDVMGQLFVRSSLFRSGVTVEAGVVDSGYEGVLGAMLNVHNPAGVEVYQDARVAQMVFTVLSAPTEGYSGQYQHHPRM